MTLEGGTASKVTEWSGGGESGRITLARYMIYELRFLGGVIYPFPVLRVTGQQGGSLETVYRNPIIPAIFVEVKTIAFSANDLKGPVVRCL